VLTVAAVAWVASGRVPDRLLAGRGVHSFSTRFETALSLEDPSPFRIENPDPSVWPEQTDDSLTLTTNFGDIQFDHTHCPNDLPPRNILWVPLQGSGPFTVTAVVDSFWPTLNFQQAGIIVASDETFHEFVKLCVIARDGLQQLNTVHQVHDNPIFHDKFLRNALQAPVEDRLLRIVRDGGTWRCETRTSFDASWQLVSQAEALQFDFEPRVAGIFAMHGFACEGEPPNRLPIQVPPTDVRFSSFAVERYPAVP
jgi:hypothetical protein